MNLRTLAIPRTFPEMQQVCDAYYDNFYLEIVRMSNSSLGAYVETYLRMLTDLSKFPGSPNIIRSAIGVVSLHRFGYNDFGTLASIFDRLIPQLDPDYVKFTSWCAGRLIHHPGVEQSRYVVHLFERCIGWSRAKGRRARPLASSSLLTALATNAGSSVVAFHHRLESVAWILVSHPSTRVLKATAEAVAMYTRALVRYGRSDLDGYLDFFTQMSTKLLSFGDPIREYAALLLFQVLIHACPDYFIVKFLHFYGSIAEAVIGEPLLVQCAAFSTLAALSQVDSKQFVNVVADELLEKTPELLLEFPKEVTESLCLMCRTIPDFMRAHMSQLEKFVSILVCEPDSAFVFMTAMIENFGADTVKVNENDVISMLERQLTANSARFFVTFAKKTDKLSPELCSHLCAKLEKELLSGNPGVALKMVAELPLSAICNQRGILSVVSKLASCESAETRKLVAPAMFNLVKDGEQSQIEMIIQKLLQMATFEQSIAVRRSILQVLYDNCSEILAKDEFLKFFEMFANDDAAIVREMVFNILAQLAESNPLAVSRVTRSALLDAFFVIRHVSSIRQKFRYIHTLPSLIRASSMTIKAYSRSFMSIALDILVEHDQNAKWDNFLEKGAHDKVLIGIIDSMALLAPKDSEQVATHGDVIIPILCEMLLTYTNRLLCISILNLFFVLLTAPAANLSYRKNCPLILRTCAVLLANTHSRKARMATLKVLGAIGVLEVHEKPPVATCQSPQNIDDRIARQFFHPSRDSEGNIDEGLVLQDDPESHEQYFTIVAATHVMDIFRDESLKEFYGDVVAALVNILQSPKMYMLSLFDSFVTRLLDVMESASVAQMRQLVPLYSNLIENSSDNSSPFLERSLQLIFKRFCRELADPFLDLILAFLLTVRDGFSPHASETICLLVLVLDDNKTTNAQTTKRVLSIFAILGVFAVELLYLIIPQICDAIWCEQTLKDARIDAFEALIDLVKTVDLGSHLTNIARAVSFGVFFNDEKTSSVAFELLYHLYRTQDTSFLINLEPLLESIREANLETEELKILAEQARQGQIVKIPHEHPRLWKSQKVQRVFCFSQEAILTKVLTPNLGLGRHLEDWLWCFIVACIENSPSASIRACTILASSDFGLATKLFNSAFLSCWMHLCSDAREQVTTSLREILVARENYETVARVILNLLMFMDKLECRLEIKPEELVAASIRYGGIAYALHIQQLIYDNYPNDLRVIGTLIDIFVKLGDWASAVGVWNKCKLKDPSLNRIEVLVRLKMWDQVEPAYREHFDRFHDFESFLGLSQSLSAMAKWSDLMSYSKHFDSLKSHQKLQVAAYYAEAAAHLGKWDFLEESLKYSPDDSSKCIALQVLNSVRKKDFVNVNANLVKGYSLLASRPITFWGDNQKINPDTMKAAQELVELDEMKRLLMGTVTREEVEEVWNERLKTAPKNFHVWFSLLANRMRFVDVRDDNIIELFRLSSATLGTKLHGNAFAALFPGFDYDKAPTLHKICYNLVQWYTGHKEDAFNEMNRLAETTTGYFQEKCHYFCADWLLEKSEDFDTLKEAYRHLEFVARDIAPVEPTSPRYMEPLKGFRVKSDKRERLQRARVQSGRLVLHSQILKEMKVDQRAIHMLRKWTYINVYLIPLDPDREQKALYAVNGIHALTRCVKIMPSFPDVVQMLNLFFEYADTREVFDMTASCIRELPPKLLLQANPQILVQLDHKNRDVAEFVSETVLQLLLEHYHALMSSVIVTTKSKIAGRCAMAKRILERFTKAKPNVFAEVELIRKCLLRAAVTWPEKVVQRSTDALDHFHRGRYDRMIGSLTSIIEMCKKPRCEMHEHFKSQFSKNIAMLEQLLKTYKVKESSSHLAQLSNWCKTMKVMLIDELKQIKMIQLSAISKELNDRTDFFIAVPGTYRPGKPVNHIKYFVGEFSVYQTKQQPKDVILKGEDGNFYQYLLKGHEDLRLDERIMQFFRLVNSLIMQETVFRQTIIQITSVIPLSLSHGLVKWVPGTDTLRFIVEKQRKLHNIEPMIEYNLTEKYSYDNFDMLLPIQKMQIINRIFREVPDTDLADFFWLRACHSEAWMKRMNTFAMSCAMTSIVGYIIGLGDRHPSNLLIDRFSGKIVHIDFGDCFEKAAKRTFLPEVVPFRLTRMMVRAMGAAGVDGLFRTFFVNMSQLLREHKNVLVMVLATFVHEPLVDPDGKEGSTTRFISKATTGSVVDTGRVYLEYSDVQSSVEMRNRVVQKLTGHDFDPNVPLSVEDQATKLITMATSTYSLASMYSGWCPYW